MSGKLYVVGIGPGKNDLLTFRAERALKESTIIIGYRVYIDLIKDFCTTQELIKSGMTKEIDRCRKALDKAEEGNIVSIISSGDTGIYGMAGPILQLVESEKRNVEVEIIPAVSAFNASAALLGAPIMHDNCIISLSDRLTPWEVIEKRLHLAAEGDFVVSLYNPKSKGRPKNIEQTQKIFLKYRDEKTVVGIVRNAERKDQSIIITTLSEMLNYDIDMFTMIIVGNKNTTQYKDKMITPRGYKL